MDIFKKLTQARKEENIYLVARFVAIAKAINLQGACLTQEEKEAMVIALSNARQGKGILPQALGRGYEIARWLMLLRLLMPDKSWRVTDQDRVEINDSAMNLKVSHNWYQLASLVQTCNFLELPLDLSLSEEDQVELDKCLAVIEN